jgi:hypothetical protein
MLLDLPLDIFFIIFYKLDNINYLINIIKTNKYFYNNIDDSYFILWGINQYTLDFWIKAKQRSKTISKPLKTMKLELLRLQSFIDTLKIQNITWSNKDFYDFWNMLEELKNKKNKSTKNYIYSTISIQQ